MTIGPLVPGAFRFSNQARLLTETRLKLDDLAQQLATDRKSQTYGGLGRARGQALDLRARVGETTGFQETIAVTRVRLDVMDRTLGRLSAIAADLRSPTRGSAFDPDADGKTSGQRLARLQFDEAIDLLNADLNGRALFAGRRTDGKPIAPARFLLDGDGTGRAGVTQLIAERRAADAGSGTGRLVLGGGGLTATVAEEAAGLPFGLKLLGAASGSAGITAGWAAGPPANVSISLTAQPAAGETVTLVVQLPDGASRNLTLVASSTAAPLSAPGTFAIGATLADTAQNLRDALAATVVETAAGPLAAASALVAAESFFAGTEAAPPLRVVGPPATATALAPGTEANTVIWYRGDTAADARATAPVRIDTARSIGTGAQANEEGFRRLLAGLAAVAAESFGPGVTERGRFAELHDRVRGRLVQQPGVQQVETIQMELALSHRVARETEDRHRVTLGVLQTSLDGIEGINREETAAMVLSLQTKLQASYQVTATISRLRLGDFLR